ncbi:MAG: heme lyase CcmF/NrfE family subunit [Acidimicrobiales bacterium]|nr:heme lyase CcmF/NrfE family subunit [Acidimicrobiales bacterium]
MNDLNIVIGKAGVLLALISSVIGLIAIGYSLYSRLKRKGTNSEKPPSIAYTNAYVYLNLAGCLIAVGAMEHALITHDFAIAFVAQNNARETPLLYTITGLWSALSGSILLWVFLLGIFSVIFVYRYRKSDSLVVWWARFVIGLVVIFFLVLLIGPADAFSKTVGAIPSDGAGPNALLQDNLLVAIHPVLLYTGFVGFTIPFALTIGRLLAGSRGKIWLYEVRKFMLIPWSCLSLGIIMGAWWSYQVLGWGGFWAWDPVENAALMPWLMATASLHSNIATENRSMLTTWSMSLVLATFNLTLLGTFLTRSGVIESVHAFANSGAVGPALAVALIVSLVGSTLLVATRGHLLGLGNKIELAWSRPAAFVANNLAFSALTLVVLVGTTFPIVASAFGNTISIGRPYYDSLSVPIGLFILIAMGVAPILSYQGANLDLLRKRLFIPAFFGALVFFILVINGASDLAALSAFGLAAFAFCVAMMQLKVSILSSHRAKSGWWRGLVGREGGGMIAHIGLVIIGVGMVAALSYGQRGEVNISPGKSAYFDGVKITYLGTRVVDLPGKTVTSANLEINGSGNYRPEITVFGNTNEGVGTPAIDSNLIRDVYLTVAELPTGANQSSIVVGVIVQPMVAWIWIGGFVVFFGGLASVLSRRKRVATRPRITSIESISELLQDKSSGSELEELKR